LNTSEKKVIIHENSTNKKVKDWDFVYSTNKSNTNSKIYERFVVCVQKGKMEKKIRNLYFLEKGKVYWIGLGDFRLGGLEYKN